MEGFVRETARNWLELEFYRVLVPLSTPAYLRDLFCSNVRMLLLLVIGEPAKLQPAA